MKTFSKYVPLAVFLCLLTYGAEARADSVVISTGLINLNGFAGGITHGQFSFGAPDMNFAGLVSEGRIPGCTLCRPGDLMEVGSQFAGENAFRGGSATIGGVSYSNIFFAGNFVFSSSPIVVPFDPAAVVTMNVPFTLNAFLSGCGQSFVIGGCTGAEIFTTSLIGQGIATLELNHYYNPGFGGDVYDFRSVSYHFEAPAPVPEPATIILFATGITGLIAGARRKRNQRI